MVSSRIFFSNHDAYLAWVRHLPLKELVRPDRKAQRKQYVNLVPDPHTTVSDPEMLPYIEVLYLDDKHPQFLIVRVDGPFRIIVRCATKEEAYFRWFHEEVVYATYLQVDRKTSPTGLLESESLAGVKEAFASYLSRSRRSAVGKRTTVLTKRGDERNSGQHTHKE